MKLPTNRDLLIKCQEFNENGGLIQLLVADNAKVMLVDFNMTDSYQDVMKTLSDFSGIPVDLIKVALRGKPVLKFEKLSDLGPK